MSDFAFDYELTFTNNFDLDVIEYSPIPDKDNNEFISLVENTLNNMELVLFLQPGVSSMSTYINFQNNTYKIFLNKV